jgi:hypothetical protein
MMPKLAFLLSPAAGKCAGERGYRLMDRSASIGEHLRERGNVLWFALLDTRNDMWLGASAG